MLSNITLIRKQPQGSANVRLKQKTPFGVACICIQQSPFKRAQKNRISHTSRALFGVAVATWCAAISRCAFLSARLHSPPWALLSNLSIKNMSQTKSADLSVFSERGAKAVQNIRRQAESNEKGDRAALLAAHRSRLRFFAPRRKKTHLSVCFWCAAGGSNPGHPD